MTPYQLIEPSYAVLRLNSDEDLFELARDARGIVETFPNELRNQIVIIETNGGRWYWLGRSASWHPQRISASNLTEALRRSNTYTYHAEVSDSSSYWIVIGIVVALFSALAGPAIYRFFF